MTLLTGQARRGHLTTVRYWAALRAAAGVDEEQVEADRVAAALTAVRDRHGPRFAEVLAVCSFLVDGQPVGARPHDEVRTGDLLDCLPPFAGG